MNERHRMRPWASLLCVFLSACHQPAEIAVPEAGTGASPEPTKTLAIVNGEPLTAADVELAMQRTFFSPSDGQHAGAEMRETVLQSLIAGRAMKQALLAEIDADELAQLQRQVKAYEEELFIKTYLARHAIPEPVTQEQVEAYYAQNADQFGQKTIYDFELLQLPANPEEAARDRFLQDVEALRQWPDWKSADTFRQTHALQYRQGQAGSGLLHPVLDAALLQLSPAGTSELLNVDGQWHLLRVNQVHRTPPRPLSEASAEIRRKLAPLQVRRAVQAVSAQVQAQAKVERMP